MSIALETTYLVPRVTNTTFPVVLGKYELLHKLAAGGMAEVFLARAAGPMGFEKQVVVKRILPHLADDPSFVAMFLAEARLAARLSHPNVVQVFDFGEADGAYFIVMEFVDGVNLRALYRKARSENEALSLSVAARLISLACEGLGYAHDFRDPHTGAPLGLVHRDVSPDNLLIARHGSVKVVDFGIAKAANQTMLTKTGNVKGKFAYMPPEQLAGETIDRRADVFALGIVLYELITGRKPFDTTNEAIIVRAILYEPFPPASEFRPEVPASLQSILDRALAKDVNQRFVDCRVFQSALEQFIVETGEPVSQYHLSQLVVRLFPHAKNDGSGSNRALPMAVPVAATIIEEEIQLSAVDQAPLTVSDGARLPPEPEPGPLPEPVQLSLSAVGEGPLVLQPESRTRLVLALVGLTLTAAAGVAYAVTRGPQSGPPPPSLPAVVKKEPAPAPKPAPALAAPDPVVAIVDPPPPARETTVLPELVPAESAPRVNPRPPPAKVVPKPKVLGQTATIEFRVRPFGSVWVDGKFLGDTPFSAAAVSIGEHQVRVTNQEMGKDVTRPFQVKAGSNVFRLSFDE